LYEYILGGFILMGMLFYSAFVMGLILYIETNPETHPEIPAANGLSGYCPELGLCMYNLLRLTFFDGDGFDMALILSKGYPFLFTMTMVYLCMTAFGIINGLLSTFGNSFSHSSSIAFDEDDRRTDLRRMARFAHKNPIKLPGMVTSIFNLTRRVVPSKEKINMIQDRRGANMMQDRQVANSAKSTGSAEGDVNANDFFKSRRFSLIIKREGVANERKTRNSEDSTSVTQPSPQISKAFRPPVGMSTSASSISKADRKSVVSDLTSPQNSRLSNLRVSTGNEDSHSESSESLSDLESLDSAELREILDESSSSDDEGPDKATLSPNKHPLGNNFLGGGSFFKSPHNGSRGKGSMSSGDIHTLIKLIHKVHKNMASEIQDLKEEVKLLRSTKSEN
jgi:hypothetical protein